MIWLFPCCGYTQHLSITVFSANSVWFTGKMSCTLCKPALHTDTLSPCSCPSIFSFFPSHFWKLNCLLAEKCVLPRLSQAINLKRCRTELFFFNVFLSTAALLSADWMSVRGSVRSWCIFTRMRNDSWGAAGLLGFPSCCCVGAGMGHWCQIC